jgi:glycosyltransferase involved in cell wall biosynthesis
MNFSVLMSVYARENPAWFDLAMQSIWDDQILKPNQIVLVKDGPLTSELDTQIELWQKKLGEVLCIVPLAENVGLGVALNKGLKHCKYELVARMDSDDISLPRRFEKQVATFLNDAKLDILGSFSTDIDEAGKLGILRSMPVEHEEIMNNLWTNPLIHPTVMFKKNKLLSSGGYSSTLRRRQDYELWFRLAKHGMKFANIPQSLFLYRFSSNSHKKQPVRLAFEQAMLGYAGTKMLNMAWWKGIACFVPFFRSILPAKLQHIVYIVGRKFDPRLKETS